MPDPMAVANAGKKYNGELATPTGPKEMKPQPEVRADLDKARYGSKDGAPQDKK